MQYGYSRKIFNKKSQITIRKNFRIFSKKYSSKIHVSLKKYKYLTQTNDKYLSSFNKIVNFDKY